MIDRCDVVYHLAAAVGVKLIVESPVNTIETNVHGTEVVLKLANKKKKKVLITSTSEVYGKSTSVPFREDQDLVLGPTTKGRWSYACSKAIDEFLAIAYWHEKRLPVVIVRLFNTVGPRQTGRYGMVIPNFVQQALNEEPITVFGDGTQSRAFGYVGDVVRALADLARHPQAVGEVFNIGNTNEITMNALAELIKQMTGSKSDIIHIPYDQAYEQGFEDMPRRVPDISKIQRLIGYQPTVASRADSGASHRRFPRHRRTRVRHGEIRVGLYPLYYGQNLSADSYATFDQSPDREGSRCAGGSRTSSARSLRTHCAMGR